MTSVASAASETTSVLSHYRQTLSVLKANPHLALDDEVLDLLLRAATSDTGVQIGVTTLLSLGRRVLVRVVDLVLGSNEEGVSSDGLAAANSLLRGLGAAINSAQEELYMADSNSPKSFLNTTQNTSPSHLEWKQISVSMIHCEALRAEAILRICSGSIAEAIHSLSQAIGAYPRVGGVFPAGLTDSLLLLGDCYEQIWRPEDALHSARLAVDTAHQQLEQMTKASKEPSYFTAHEGPTTDSYTAVVLAYCGLAKRLLRTNMVQLASEWFERAAQTASHLQLSSELQQATTTLSQMTLQLSHQNNTPTQPSTEFQSPPNPHMPHPNVVTSQPLGISPVWQGSSSSYYSIGVPLNSYTHSNIPSGASSPRLAEYRENYFSLNDREAEIPHNQSYDVDGPGYHETYGNPGDYLHTHQQLRNRTMTEISPLGYSIVLLPQQDHEGGRTMISSSASEQRSRPRPRPRSANRYSLLSTTPAGNPDSARMSSETNNSFHNAISHNKKELRSSSAVSANVINKTRVARAVKVNRNVPSQTLPTTSTKNSPSTENANLNQKNRLTNRGQKPVAQALIASDGNSVPSTIRPSTAPQKMTSTIASCERNATLLATNEFVSERMERTPGLSLPFFRGLIVEARYQPRRLGERSAWYPARIVRVNIANAVYSVVFENGDRDDVSVDDIRIPEYASRAALARVLGSLKKKAVVSTVRSGDRSDAMDSQRLDASELRERRNKLVSDMNSSMMRIVSGIHNRADDRKCERLTLKVRLASRIQALVRGMLVRKHFEEIRATLIREQRLRVRERDLREREALLSASKSTSTTTEGVAAAMIQTGESLFLTEKSSHGGPSVSASVIADQLSIDSFLYEDLNTGVTLDIHPIDPISNTSDKAVKSSGLFPAAIESIHVPQPESQVQVASSATMSESQLMGILPTLVQEVLRGVESQRIVTNDTRIEQLVTELSEEVRKQADQLRVLDLSVRQSVASATSAAEAATAATSVFMANVPPASIAETIECSGNATLDKTQYRPDVEESISNRSTELNSPVNMTPPHNEDPTPQVISKVIYPSSLAESRPVTAELQNEVSIQDFWDSVPSIFPQAMNPLYQNNSIVSRLPQTDEWALLGSSFDIGELSLSQRATPEVILPDTITQSGIDVEVAISDDDDDDGETIPSHDF